jgi:hypothetical protein
MPTGTGAIAIRNLPVTKYQINPGLFNQLTSRVIFDPINFALPAFGNYQNTQLLQVGIVSAINIIVTGSIVTVGTTVTVAPTAHWPWDLISVQISGNGQNNFISCTGWDLTDRLRAANRAYVDTVSTFVTAAGAAPFNVATAAGGTNSNFTLAYKIPIAMDDTTLVGALYAQSEATNLVLKITTRNQADLFNITAGTLAISVGQVYIEEEIFEVPYDPQHSDTLVIPDLTVLHGLVSNDNAVASQTTLDTQLFRINGQLERLMFQTWDLTTAAAPNVVATATYVQTQLIYGSNQNPYTFNPMSMLDFRNNRDYRVNFPEGHYVIDFVADNPARDLVLLEGVTNLRLRTQYGTAPTGGSFVHFVQETLFA